MNPDTYISLKIRDMRYPVTITGNGIPCLAIGIGTLMQRSLSKRFKETFEIYSSDLYWDAAYGLQDPASLNLDMIIDDIVFMGKSFHLNKPIILAHSAYGIVALELAKKYPDYASGIIMIGTPVNSNPHVAEKNNRIFEQEADDKRKAIDKERRTQVDQEDLTKLSLSDRFLREYIYRDAPRYWYIPDYDCSHLWRGIVLSPVIDNFFAKILPSVQIERGLEKINIPIFLAAGLSDYDCCPWLWHDLPNLPPRMTISLFEKSGHWPHYEEAGLFDKWVITWAENIK